MFENDEDRENQPLLPSGVISVGTGQRLWGSAQYIQVSGNSTLPNGEKIQSILLGDQQQFIRERGKINDLTRILSTMLPAHLVLDNGLRIVIENSDLVTNIRVAVADLDVSGAYPTTEWVENVSKATTSKELIQIQYVSEEDQRRASINLSAGKTNAVEICTTLYKLPELSDMLKMFNNTTIPSKIGNQL